MNRSIILILTVTLLLSFSMGIVAQEPEQLNDSLSDSIFYSPDYNSIDINDYIIRLPQEGMNMRDFETKYLDRLKELANRYGNGQNNLLDIVFTEEDLGNSNVDDEGINIQPASNVSINLGYEQEDKNDVIENKTAVELNYDVGDRTSVTAGYEFQNVKEYDVVTNSPSLNDLMEDNSSLVNDQNNIDSRLGISYQTTDKIKIFADYVYNDILLEQSGQSTVFGLEYNNKDSVISAEYRIGNELGEAGRTTGLTYQYQNLASFSASYKLLDPEQLEDQLKQQEWDFGVDFNLNEESSFSIGLQVINNQILNTDSENSEENTTEESQETNVEASFKIKF